MKLTKPNKTLSIENLTREISEPKYDMTKLLPVRKFLKVCERVRVRDHGWFF